MTQWNEKGNIAVAAAWKIHKESIGNLSQLKFLPFTFAALMKTEDAIINYNRQWPCEYVNVDMRFDKNNHYIEGAKKQSRCKVC